MESITVAEDVSESLYAQCGLKEEAKQEPAAEVDKAHKTNQRKESDSKEYKK